MKKKINFKLSLKSRISLWFVVIILIAAVLYGALIFVVYQFNLRGERYFDNLKQHPKFDPNFIERIRELEKFDQSRKEMFPTAIMPPHIFTRVFVTITGGVLFIIIGAAAGGFIFLNRMLRQVNFITRNVKEINDKKLHIRLNLKGKDSIANMAQTFDAMLDQIERSFIAQKQFVQNASHEINTPLTIIKTKLGILKQKKMASINDYKSTFNIIEEETDRLSRITQDLLILTDIEDNNISKYFVPVRINQELEKILKLFDNRIGEKNLRLKITTGSDLELTADKHQIEQLIFNLLDNAIKYSNPGTTIEINISEDSSKNNIIFSMANITDSISREQIPFIFDRFYKVNVSSGGKGYGLGLSIVKKIVENHNGKIDAIFEDYKNKIIFTITLPVKGKQNGL